MCSSVSADWNYFHWFDLFLSWIDCIRHTLLTIQNATYASRNWSWCTFVRTSYMPLNLWEIYGAPVVVGRSSFDCECRIHIRQNELFTFIFPFAINFKYFVVSAWRLRMYTIDTNVNVFANKWSPFSFAIYIATRWSLDTLYPHNVSFSFLLLLHNL